MASNPASEPDNDPVKEYILKLDTRKLALHTHAAEDDVLRVLQAVQVSADQKPNARKQHDGSLESIQSYFMEIVKALDIATVAVNYNIAANIVQRVLNGLLGHDDGETALSPKTDTNGNGNKALTLSTVQSRARIDTYINEIRTLASPRAIDVPAPCLGGTDWPGSHPAHVRLLFRAFTHVLSKGKEYGQSGLVVSKHDLLTLARGVRSLSSKMSIQATNLVNNLPVEHQGQYVDEEWYLGPRLQQMIRANEEDPKKHELARSPGNSPIKKKSRADYDAKSMELEKGKGDVTRAEKAVTGPTANRLVPILSVGRPRTTSLAMNPSHGSMLATAARNSSVPARFQTPTSTPRPLRIPQGAPGLTQQQNAPPVPINGYRPIQPRIWGGGPHPDVYYNPFRIPAPVLAPPALIRGPGGPMLPPFIPRAVSGPVSGVEDAGARMKKLHKKLDAAIIKARKAAGMGEDK